MKKVILVAIFFTGTYVASAQGFRTVLQEAIDDYYIPILAFVIIASASSGLIANWKLINDSEDEGRRKKGLQQAGMIALYTFLTIAIIGVVVGLASGIRINI